MPHAEVGVQNDPIHAIVAAAQEILIQSAQPICHGGYARRTPAYFKLPRRGHFFADRSEKKRSCLPEQTRKLAEGKQKSKLPARWFRGPCLRAAMADSIGFLNSARSASSAK